MDPYTVFFLSILINIAATSIAVATGMGIYTLAANLFKGGK